MRKLLVAIALTVAIAAVSQDAAASSFDGACVVTNVGFANDTWGHALFIACSSGKLYYAYLSGPAGCQYNGAWSILDDIHQWETLATAAHLAGKNAQVTYNPVSSCNGSSANILASFTVQ